MRQLSENLVKGDHKAFDTIFNKLFNKVVFFINWHINNLEESKDIAQNAFVILWQKRATINPNLPIEGYLFKIAKNLSLDYLKHQKVKRRFQTEKVNLEHSIISELNEISLELFDTEKYRASSLKNRFLSIISRFPLGHQKVFFMS